MKNLTRPERRALIREARPEAVAGHPDLRLLASKPDLDTPQIRAIRAVHAEDEAKLRHAYTDRLAGTLRPFLEGAVQGTRLAPPDALGVAARASRRLRSEIVETLDLLVQLKEGAKSGLEILAAHANTKITYVVTIVVRHHPDADLLGDWTPGQQVARLNLADVPEIYRLLVEELLGELPPVTAARFRGELLAAS
jgi:hypothetical protein